MSDDGMAAAGRGRAGGAAEVFRAFLALGLTSFGGPVAHIGFFREAFVAKRGWLSERAYADLVALCQFLPGPASSQVGMAIGLLRAGPLGMLAAWTAFTLPSALLLVGFAYGAAALGDGGWIAGLKAAAVGVVAHALLGMARTLTPDAPRLGIAALAAAVALLIPSAWGQVATIALGGALGLALPRRPVAADAGEAALRVPVGRRTALVALCLFAAGFALLPLLARLDPGGPLALADSFYRAGALVFGGGHVVLPLLEAEIVGAGLVGRDAFLAGYGAAQAVPGPLFTFAAYLGALADGPLGAAVALAAVFAPSALLVLGALPFWERLRRAPNAQAALAGVNAAVVGLLAAAFVDPVLRHGATSAATAAIALGAFAALLTGRLPAWAVVLAAGALGAALA